MAQLMLDNLLSFLHDLNRGCLLASKGPTLASFQRLGQNTCDNCLAGGKVSEASLLGH